jgi:hypothetical protein
MNEQHNITVYHEAVRLAVVALRDISQWDSVDVVDIRKYATYAIEHVERLLREDR